MANQTGKGLVVAYKAESTFNTAPGGTGATEVRLKPSPGLNMTRQLIEAGEIKPNQLQAMARLGSRAVAGGYNGNLSLSSWDDWLQYVMRASAWTAAVAITQTEMTSITTTTSTIVAAAGNWINEGVRVGDVVRLTGHATTANNDLNLRVTGVTSTTITVAGTPLTADAVADTSFTLTILKKLSSPTTPSKTTIYVDEYNQDIDQSLVFGGAFVTGFTLRGTPDGMAEIEWRLVAASQSPLATGSSPYYSSNTQYTTKGLTFVDATIRYGGADVAIATSFELVVDLGAQGQPVIGSSTTPDIFPDDMDVSGTITAIRTDLQAFTDFDAETPFEIQILLVEPDASAPIDCMSFFMGNVIWTGPNGPLGQPGALIDTLPFKAAEKETTSGYDVSSLTICSSAA